MGILSGFSYREAARKLRVLGFEFDRYAKGSHEIWYNREARRRTTIPHHPGDLPSAFSSHPESMSS